MKKNSKIILKVEASTNFIKEDDISKSSKENLDQFEVMEFEYFVMLSCLL